MCAMKSLQMRRMARHQASPSRFGSATTAPAIADEKCAGRKDVAATAIDAALLSSWTTPAVPTSSTSAVSYLAGAPLGVRATSTPASVSMTLRRPRRIQPSSATSEQQIEERLVASALSKHGMMWMAPSFSSYPDRHSTHQKHPPLPPPRMPSSFRTPSPPEPVRALLQTLISRQQLVPLSVVSEPRTNPESLEQHSHNGNEPWIALFPDHDNEFHSGTKITIDHFPHDKNPDGFVKDGKSNRRTWNGVSQSQDSPDVSIQPKLWQSSPASSPTSSQWQAPLNQVKDGEEGEDHIDYVQLFQNPPRPELLISDHVPGQQQHERQSWRTLDPIIPTQSPVESIPLKSFRSKKESKIAGDGRSAMSSSEALSPNEILRNQFHQAVWSHPHASKAMRAFYKLCQVQPEQASQLQQSSGDVWDLATVRQLFLIVASAKRPVDAFAVLKYYQKFKYQQEQQHTQVESQSDIESNDPSASPSLLDNSQLNAISSETSPSSGQHDDLGTSLEEEQVDNQDPRTSMTTEQDQNPQEQRVFSFKNRVAAIMAQMHNISIDVDADVGMYARCCDCVRHLDPHDSFLTEIQLLVRSLVSDVQRMQPTNQAVVLPILLSSMACQRSAKTGFWAGKLYQYMLEQPWEVSNPGGFFEHLMSLSRYNRQSDLPFADIMRRAVEAGRRPHPHVARNLLDNLFPYTADEQNATDTLMALQAIVDLQRQTNQYKQHDQQQESDSILKYDGKEYRVDMAVLEMIAAGTTKSGHLPLLLLVWDGLDVMRLTPSAALYEHTAVAFVANGAATYAHAWAVLADMQQQGGHIPSRACIRSLSTILRKSDKMLKEAAGQLKDWQNLQQPSSTQSGTISGPAWNAILSGWAERGDLDRALYILEVEFPTHSIQPNADSFDFCLEAAGKQLSRVLRHATSANSDSGRTEVEHVLNVAESILTGMDQQGLAPTSYVIRDYVELLCLAGEVDTATAVLMDVRAAASTAPLFNSKSIYRVSMEHVKRGNFAMAREVAALSPSDEHVPFLMENIQRLESRAKVMALKTKAGSNR